MAGTGLCCWSEQGRRSRGALIQLWQLPPGCAKPFPLHPLGALLRQLSTCVPARPRELGKPTPWSVCHERHRETPLSSEHSGNIPSPAQWSLVTEGHAHSELGMPRSSPARLLGLLAAALPINPGSIFLRENLSPSEGCFLSRLNPGIFPKAVYQDPQSSPVRWH